MQTSQSLDEGYDLVVTLPTADIVMPDNDGKVSELLKFTLTSVRSDVVIYI